MSENIFDYDPDKDKLPAKVTFWIIIAAIGMAMYLSMILV